jgi:hypothetical protein
VPSPDWRQLADALTQVIGLEALPIAITFAAERPESVPAFDASMPPPTPDGRTGRISAGCVFWMRGRADLLDSARGPLQLQRREPDPEEVAGNSDVAALLESG